MKVSRDGLGYRADILGEGIGMSVDRIVETRGETWAELTVERAPEGHLMRSRVSLTAAGARTAAAKYLERRSNSVDWVAHLETFFLEVLRREREGEPVMTIGNLPSRPGIEYLLEPMLAIGAPTILYGSEGTGKSTLAAAITVSVATGRPCLAGWRVREPRQVLILDWEGNADAWNALIKACAYGIDVAPPDVLYRPMSAALTTDLHTIARIVTEREVGLVVIDSVGLASPSAREGADANDAAVRLFSAIRHLKVTSLLIDHVNKTDNSGGDSRPYGSVYKPALARATYEIRAAEQPDLDGTRHLGLFHRKDNLVGLRPPVGIAVRRDTAIVELKVEPVHLDDARIAKGATIKDRLADALREGALSVEELAAMVDADPGVVRRTLNRYRDRFTQVEKAPGGAARWGLLARGGTDGTTVSGHVSPWTSRGVGQEPLKGSLSSTTVPVLSRPPGKWDGLKELKPLGLPLPDVTPDAAGGIPAPGDDEAAASGDAPSQATPGALDFG